MNSSKKYNYIIYLACFGLIIINFLKFKGVHINYENIEIFISSFTLYFLIIYTKETTKLREEAQNQNKLSKAPFLKINTRNQEIKFKDETLQILEIENVNSNPAINSVIIFKSKENKFYLNKIGTDGIDCIVKGDKLFFTFYEYNIKLKPKEIFDLRNNIKQNIIGHLKINEDFDLIILNPIEKEKIEEEINKINKNFDYNIKDILEKMEQLESIIIYKDQFNNFLYSSYNINKEYFNFLDYGYLSDKR